MAQLATVSITLEDSFGRRTKRAYQHRTADPAADVNALVAGLAAITRLGVREIVISKPNTTATLTEPANEASIAQDASLQVRKSTLNDSRGGTYSFNLPHPKPALINADGTLDISDAAFTGWVEFFDDGAGLAGIAGDWFVSDGEELPEGTASDNAIIKGSMAK